MAWNPSPEVAAARNAAKALGDVPIAVLVYVTKDGKHVGMASYGRTRELCDQAGKLGDELFEQAMGWMSENGDSQK